jgi:murein L,D-transpeptidase YcbB/YkuD
MRHLYHSLAFFLLFTLSVQAQQNSLPRADSCNELYMWLLSPGNRLDGEQIYQPDLAITFYTDRNCQAAWYDPIAQFARIDSLMSILNRAQMPENTHYLYLERSLDEIQSFYVPLGLFDYQELYSIDVFLTDAALNYALQIVAESYGDESIAPEVSIALSNQLETALQKNQLSDFFEKLHTQVPTKIQAGELQKATAIIEQAEQVSPQDTLPQKPIIIKDYNLYNAVMLVQNVADTNTIAGERVALPSVCNDFYKQRQFTLAWLPHTNNNVLIKTLLVTLKSAGAEGLQPKNYHIATLEKLLNDLNSMGPSNDQTSQYLDILLSDAALLYAQHLALGKVNPRKLGFSWDVYQNSFEWATELQKAISGNNLNIFYTKMMPKQAQYGYLKNALAKYQALPPDSLKESDQKRIEKLKIAMETWRWLPNDLGRRYILVNIPAYMLYLYENNGAKPSQSKRVVVGELSHKTPVFSDQMQYIELNPYWTVPPSIAKKEILPALKKSGAGYLKRNKMEVLSGGEKMNPASINWSKYSSNNFPFTIRQKPNAKNALGEVKFLFPNSYNVYIHDTPSRHLFAQSPRAFSHGCIRLHEPLDFAAYLLKDMGYNRARIDQIIKGSNNQSITLPHPIPVYIIYLPAWADEEKAYYYDDVYSRAFKF